MSFGLVGKKVGMTRVFTDDGASVAVTVLEVQPNHVAQVKSVESDGYNAIQVTTGNRKASRVNKAAAGHFEKAGVPAGRGLWEFRLDDVSEYQPGSDLKVDLFEAGQVVDVTGYSKGKGFAGTIKRHNFAGKDATHGNSINHRTPGSIGQCQTPGRVFKGKKMSGHLGDVKTTTQNLKVHSVDTDRNLLLIKGAVPGARDGDVIVRPAMKVRR